MSSTTGRMRGRHICVKIIFLFLQLNISLCVIKSLQKGQRRLYLTSTSLLTSAVNSEKLTTTEIIKRIFSPLPPNNLASDAISSLHTIGNNQLTTLKLPSTKAEAWRYNNLFKLFKLPYYPIQSNLNTMGDSHPDIQNHIHQYINEDCATSFYVFVDGKYSSTLSCSSASASASPSASPSASVSSMTQSTFIMQTTSTSSDNVFQSLSSDPLSILKEYEQELTFIPDSTEPERHSFGSDILTALNLANMEDGGIIHIPKNTIMPQPIQVLFVSTGKPSTITHPKLVVILEEGSSLTLKQSFITLNSPSTDEPLMDQDSSPYLINGNTRVILGPESRLFHTFVQEMKSPARHTEVLSAKLNEKSDYKLSLIQTGSDVERLNLHVDIGHSHANFTVKGAILATAGQSLDLHSSIIHNAPSSNSLQQQRNVVGDQGEAIFKGRIRIPKIAQMTASEQLCRSLMIGDKARIVAMPTLEITADNVVCSHGAAISDLDENSLFYLASRGLDRKESRQLLLRSFVLDMLDQATMDSKEIGRVLAKLQSMSDNSISNEKGKSYLSL